MAKRIRKPKNASVDNDKRQALFDLLISLGLKTPPGLKFGILSEMYMQMSIQRAIANMGLPDEIIMDENSFEAYKKLFQK